MKNFIAYIMMITFGFFLALPAALAEERVKTFELAESGIIIEFPMTADEIAAENAENARQAALEKKPRERQEQIELAESGLVIEFPMTAEERAAEDAENARRAAVRGKDVQLPDRPAVVFELAESGQTIEFPVKATRTVQKMPDTEIAKGGAESAAFRVR